MQHPCCTASFLSVSHTATKSIFKALWVAKILKYELICCDFFSSRGDYVNALAHYEKGITGDNKVTLHIYKICLMLQECVFCFILKSGSYLHCSYSVSSW